MNEQECLDRMVRPGAIKPRKWGGGIIQVHLNRACDLACSNCTQLSQLRGKSSFLNPDQAEEAFINLKDYHGVVGIFGGNPALNPHFEEICVRLRKHIPFERRGIWCNHPKGKGAIMRSTFNPHCSNLNVHMVGEAYDEFRRDWPEAMIFGIDRPGVRNAWAGDSRHSPVWISPMDLEYLPGEQENTEENRLNYIANCDINIHWSAMICLFRNQLRFFFCEIAGAQAMYKQDDPNYPDTGLPLTPRVWDGSMHDYVEQVRQHCHRCSVPLRGYGELATRRDGVEHVSQEYVDKYQVKYGERLVQLVTKPEEFGARSLERMTDYCQNSAK